MEKRNYYVEFDIKSQKYQVIDCTNPVKQPVIKEYRQAAAAAKFLYKLKIQ